MVGRRALLLVACSWTASCGVDGAPPRGFGSRQLLAVRDPQLHPSAFTQDQSKVYLSRYLEPPPAFGLFPPYDVSTLDLATREQQPVAPAVFSATRLDGGPEHGRTLALLHYPSAADVPPDFTSLVNIPKPGRLVLSLVNETTDRRVDISDVADRQRTLLGTSDVAPIAVDRFDATSDIVHLWYGPPDALRPTPGPVDLIIGFDKTGAFGDIFAGLVQLQPELLHLPFDGGDTTTLVPTALGEHTDIPDETGQAITPDPDSGGPLDQRYSCAYASSTEDPSRCFFAYTRAGTGDNPTRLFVRAVSDPRELALPGAIATPDFILTRTSVVWTAQGPSGNRLYSWTFGADRAVSCAVPPGQLRTWLWNAGQDRFAVGVGDRDGSRLLPYVLVLGVAGGACQVITPEAQYYNTWTFSSDDTVLAWNQQLADNTTVIHLTATDGRGASDANNERQIVLPGYVHSSTFLPGDQRLLIRRDQSDGTSLSWIDLADESPTDHAIADRVAFPFAWTWIDARWLLLADSRSDQDDTFSLHVVNIETGTSRLVSNAVTDFVSAWQKRPPDATTLPIAYMVRGRTPSTQDGLWTATINLSEFSP